MVYNSLFLNHDYPPEDFWIAIFVFPTNFLTTIKILFEK
jgi:hypothetical protein